MPLDLCNAQVTRTYKLKIMAGSQQILSQSATEEKGDIARLASFVGALAVSDLVKTTLGPKGMDKILQSIHVDNPAAKVLIDISKVQDAEVGDGTTSVVVLAGELLREAEKLINHNVHPMVRRALASSARLSAPARR